MQDSLVGRSFNLFLLSLFLCSLTCFIHSHSLVPWKRLVMPERLPSVTHTHVSLLRGRVCLATGAHWNYVVLATMVAECFMLIIMKESRRERGWMVAEWHRFCLWPLNRSCGLLWKTQTSLRDEGDRILRNTLLGSITSCAAWLSWNEILDYGFKAVVHPKIKKKYVLQFTPGVTALSPGGPVSSKMFSFKPTCLNTPALKFQIYQARPWLAGSGLFD